MCGSKGSFVVVVVVVGRGVGFSSVAAVAAVAVSSLLILDFVVESAVDGAAFVDMAMRAHSEIVGTDGFVLWGGEGHEDGRVMRQ